MGVANLGGAGKITVDGETFALANRDVLYIGRGAEKVTLTSDDPAKPARFYMNSVPAGRDIPHRLITQAEAKALDLGDEARSNKRRLRMYIHPEVAPSSLLLMGSPISHPEASGTPCPHTSMSGAWKPIAISTSTRPTGSFI